MSKKTTHFHSSDERFCGSKKQGRRFTFDENEVTCQRCKNNDCFVLSDIGAQYVAFIAKHLQVTA